MSVITKLKVQTKNKNRVNVYLDDNYFCALELETIIKNSLKVGDEVTEEALEKYQLESEKSVVFTKTLNYISKAMKTKKQISDYLKKKGYTKGIIKEVLDKLTEYGYVNDENYAKMYVRQNLKNSGVNKLRQALILKGVAKNIIDEVLTELPSQEENIKALIEKYMKNKQNTQKNLSKLYAYLMRRGFLYEDVKPIIAEWRDNDESGY